MGYRFTSVYNQWHGAFSIKDPEIIQWVSDQGAVWVHADDSAKKDHAKLIIGNQIRTIWIYRKNGIMSGRDQLRVLSFSLPAIIENFDHWPSRRHYKLSVHGVVPSTKIKLTQYEIKPP